MKTDGMVTSYVQQKTNRSATTSADKSMELLTNGRGRAPAPNRISIDPIKDHINSYHPQLSHYKREHAPHRTYLESYLTTTYMWRDYEYHQKVSYQIYRKVFECEKITFGQPSQDDCDVFKQLTSHLQQVGMSLDSLRISNEGSKSRLSSVNRTVRANSGATRRDDSDPAAGPCPSVGEPATLHMSASGQQVRSNALTLNYYMPCPAITCTRL